MNKTLKKLPVPTSITFGYGSISKIGSIVSKYGKSALVVCGRKSARKYGHLNRLMDLLEIESIKSIIFDQISPEPKIK